MLLNKNDNIIIMITITKIFKSLTAESESPHHDNEIMNIGVNNIISNVTTIITIVTVVITINTSGGGGYEYCNNTAVRALV